MHLMQLDLDKTIALACQNESIHIQQPVHARKKTSLLLKDVVTMTIPNPRRYSNFLHGCWAVQQPTYISLIILSHNCQYPYENFQACYNLCKVATNKVEFSINEYNQCVIKLSTV